jgi:hypothetical protein
MRYLRFLAALLICSAIPALADPVPQNPAFQTKANLSVDTNVLSLSSAVVIAEARNYPAGYSWVRIHFYAFPLTPDDIATAKTGNADALDQKANKTSYDPKIHTTSRGVIQLSVDQDFKVWQMDMSIPGHACTIAASDKEAQSLSQVYHYDGKNLRLKSKGSHVCDLKAVGAGEQAYKWDIDVTLPVFQKPPSKK